MRVTMAKHTVRTVNSGNITPPPASRHPFKGVLDQLCFCCRADAAFVVLLLEDKSKLRRILDAIVRMIFCWKCRRRLLIWQERYCLHEVAIQAASASATSDPPPSGSSGGSLGSGANRTSLPSRLSSTHRRVVVPFTFP